MPIIKSAEKRMRQAQVRHRRNVGYKKAVKAQTKAVHANLDSKELKKAAEALKLAVSQIDRAVKKGVMHKNTGARRKSKLTRDYNQLAKTPFGTENPGKPATKSKSSASKTTAKKAPASKKPVAKKSPAKKSTTTKKTTK